MRIHRLSFLDGARAARGAVVVIDVYRAFTTAAVLHHLGAGPIALVETPEEAIALRARRGGFAVGEVGGIPCPGFDEGNSPSRILAGGRARWAGHPVALRSSAGVQGVLAAMEGDVDVVYAGAFVTGRALVETIRRVGHDEVSLVAMGVDGRREAPEDEACAAWLEALLLGAPWDEAEGLASLLGSPETEKFLSGGHAHFPAADPLVCLQRDLFPFALVATRDEAGVVLQAVK